MDPDRALAESLKLADTTNQIYGRFISLGRPPEVAVQLTEVMLRTIVQAWSLTGGRPRPEATP